MARIRQIPVERPKASYKALRVLGDGFGKIAARRRNRADNGNRSFPAAQRIDASRPLVKTCKACRKIGGKAFFGRHLFHATGKLAERFRPAACRICHDRDCHTHIAVIFGKRDARIQRHFTRGDGHIRRIRDEDRAFHDGASRPRIDDFGEFGENVGHFVSALSAADVDDEIGIAPLCNGVLRHRFARTETAGNRRSSALRQRKKHVDNAEPRNEGLGYRKLFGIGTRSAHRPILRKFYLFVQFRRRNDIVDGTIAASFKCFKHAPADIGRHHNRMQNGRRFPHRPERGSRRYRRTLPDRFSVGSFSGIEVPGLFRVERFGALTRKQKRSPVFVHRFERALDTVVNRTDKSRPEPERQRASVAYDLFTDVHAGVVFVNLNGCFAFILPDDFADKLFFADIDDIV